MARPKILEIPPFITSRHMAGAFLGGVGGIDSPHALVPELSVTSSPINQNLNPFNSNIPAHPKKELISLSVPML